MTISHQTSVEYEDALSKSMLKYFLWCIWCLHSSTVSQHIPGWAGLISGTDQVRKRLTTIDYYPIINSLTTDYSTVQECLRVSKNASREVGQKYAVTTLDLGLCMEAYPIIRKSPDFYEVCQESSETGLAVCAMTQLSKIRLPHRITQYVCSI